MVFVPKPGKKDTSDPTNLKPMSLLNVKGKGLEKLVAKRLAHIVIIEKLVPPHYVGALPGVLVANLIHVLVYSV